MKLDCFDCDSQGFVLVPLSGESDVSIPLIRSSLMSSGSRRRSRRHNFFLHLPGLGVLAAVAEDCGQLCGSAADQPLRAHLERVLVLLQCQQ